MKTSRIAVAFTAALTLSIPAAAETQLPGMANAEHVLPGRYAVDTNHTQVVWTVNHMGISPLSGAIAASGGALELDPSRPSSAKVTVTFKVADMTTTVPAFTQHLLSADLFEADKYPTISFTSTSVQVDGKKARVEGDLTLKGVTKPVILNAEFFGAGINPMNKSLEVGFSATTQIKRNEFGLGYGVPGVTPDAVDLRISAAFSRIP